MSETEQVRKLYDNLTPYSDGDDDDTIYVVNNTDGMRYLTVAIASEGGDAGGPRMTSSQSHRLFPGLNLVSKPYSARVEADAKRQRERGGGVLEQMLEGIQLVKDLSSTSVSKVEGWLMASANIQLVKDLRSHPKHGAAAHKAFDAWHSREASDATKTLRYFWASATGSQKVA